MLDFVLVIRFQILVRTETGGGPAGPPFYSKNRKKGMFCQNRFLHMTSSLINCNINKIEKQFPSIKNYNDPTDDIDHPQYFRVKSMTEHRESVSPVNQRHEAAATPEINVEDSAAGSVT